MSTSTPYHHGDLKVALLQTAGEMLEKHGLSSIRLRELARRAGVSHNAPYRHFPDRESLLAALAAEGFELLGHALEKRPRREMGEAYVEFALQHPQRFRLMLSGVASGGERRAYEGLLKSFADLGDDAQYAAAAAWALVHGLSQLLLDGHFASRDKKQFVGDVLSTVRFSAPRKS
jgi:AcrR family transcriptional regulator